MGGKRCGRLAEELGLPDFSALCTWACNSILRQGKASRAAVDAAPSLSVGLFRLFRGRWWEWRHVHRVGLMCFGDPLRRLIPVVQHWNAVGRDQAASTSGRASCG